MSSRRTQQSRKPVNKTITKYDLSGPKLDEWLQEQAASKVSPSIRATPTYTNSYGQKGTIRHSPPTRKQGGPRKGGKTKKAKKSKRKTKKRVSNRRKRKTSRR